MDKASYAAKRKQDKYHKKPPPPKPAKQKSSQKAPEVQHTAPLVVCDDRYGKRQLQQNRNVDLELPSSDSDTDDTLQAPDFQKLLELPPSSANHFLLSSEKRWLQSETDLPGEDEQNHYSEYFRIDTKQLNASLGCIPFYERHGYDPALFSTLELNLMRQKAEIHRNKYQQTYADQLASQTQSGPVSRKKENMPLPMKPHPPPCFVGAFAKPMDVSSAKSPETKHVRVEVYSTNTMETKMKDLAIDPEPRKIVTNIVPPTVPAVQTVTTTKEPASSSKDTKEEIQQWLDDILDI